MKTTIYNVKNENILSSISANSTDGNETLQSDRAAMTRAVAKSASSPMLLSFVPSIGRRKFLFVFLFLREDISDGFIFCLAMQSIPLLKTAFFRGEGLFPTFC